MAEQLKRDPHRVACVQLPQIAHMHLGREGGVAALLQIGRPDTEQFVSLINRPVEQHMVIGHVHMAVVVDPGRLDLHHRRDEWGKEQRFEIEAVEHG